MTDSMPHSTLPGLPRGAIRLGWAGVLPFLGLALAAWWPAASDPAVRAFLAYGALILSFLATLYPAWKAVRLQPLSAIAR